MLNPLTAVVFIWLSEYQLGYFFKCWLVLDWNLCTIALNTSDLFLPTTVANSYCCIRLKCIRLNIFDNVQNSRTFHENVINIVLWYIFDMLRSNWPSLIFLGPLNKSSEFYSLIKNVNRMVLVSVQILTYTLSKILSWLFGIRYYQSNTILESAIL